MAPVGPLDAGSSFGGSVFRANLRMPPRFGSPLAAGLAASAGLAAAGAVVGAAAGAAGFAASAGLLSAGFGAAGAEVAAGDAGACVPQAARRPLAASPPMTSP